MAQHDEALVRVRPPPEPAEVDRLDRSAARPSSRRAPARPAGGTAREQRRARRVCAASSSTSRSAPSPAFATSAATATGRSRWIARSRKMTKRRIPSPRNDPASVMPTFGTLSSSTCRMSVYENVNVPIRTAEHGLERPVAVEDPHVAGRERPRRHLDDEDADGDDEAHEAHARSHDCGQYSLGGRGGVLPARAEVDDRAEICRHEAEDPAEHPADQRHHPQALPQVAAKAERDAPGHWRFLSSSRRKCEGSGLDENAVSACGGVYVLES